MRINILTNYFLDLKKPSEWTKILTSQHWIPKPNYAKSLQFLDPFNKCQYSLTESIIRMMYRNRDVYQIEIKKIESILIYNQEKYIIEFAKNDATEIEEKTFLRNYLEHL